MLDALAWDKILELLKYNPQDPLIFSSGLFLFLFLGFTLLYSCVRKNLNLRVLYVIIFSLYFYYKTSGMHVLLLVLLSLSDYSIGFAIDKTQDSFRRRMWLILSVAINLGILCYFKYATFIFDLVPMMYNPFADADIFLPIGISFFTFQSMSYTIDIYRQQIKPTQKWWDYLFYLSFFPQLVAGPIVRAKDFLPQVYKNPIYVSRVMFGEGIFLIMSGLFKKAVISDFISVNFVDRVFDNPMLYNGTEVLLGVYGYAMQIYCDFSGYSDMAIGIALILGYRFNKNFDSPYKSATITEFWRRWHISLSSWLKDYLYISLGGNRKGRVRTYVNLILTMLLGGLWHGAAIRFLLWGALHGTALAIHKGLMHLFPQMKADGEQMKPLWRVLGIIFTFHLVCFGWILFRADDMAMFSTIMTKIFTELHIETLFSVLFAYKAVFALLIMGYILHFTPERVEIAAADKVIAAPMFVKALMMALIIWFVMQIKSADVQPFIYFQF